MAACTAAASYIPRNTARCDAVTIVREHLPQFVARLDEHAGALPAFVRDELEAFVGCGDFERGFLLAHCRRCGDAIRVPFSCKSRGICPSCMGRRMAETAALLADHRLPSTPYRQWVLSFEGPLAVRLGYDVRLLTRVCQRFAKRVMQCLRRRVRRERALPTVRSLAPGVMIVVQRFRNDLQIYVHLHALVTDGCFVTDGDDDPEFLAVDSLDERDLLRVLSALDRDLTDDDPDDDDVDDAVAACLALGASCSARPTSVSPRESPMTVSAHGMQLHATTTVDGRDRRRLERVCKYLLRPAFAHDAVVAMPDGNVRILYKRPTRAGATFTTISRDAFLARLCALVPPPKFHMVRYYGVIAPAHAIRPAIVPRTPVEAPPKQLAMFLPAGDVDRIATSAASVDAQVRVPSPSRIAWARLLARVFSIDVERCRRCGGPMRVVAAVTDVDEIAAHLHGARAPPVPSPPGQLALFAR